MQISPEVERLFHELVDLNPEQRAGYLREHPTDPDILSALEALLFGDNISDTTLTSLIRHQVDSVLGQVGSSRLTEIGPYRLLRLLGRGGMGEVWLAERIDRLLKRQVALKLPHAGLYSEHFIERAHRERDILASLTHPGIARLYDAGVAAGRPYLALEFVEGCSITAYCDTHRLSIPERLRLFLQILRAIQYAHAHLVVHRDLKPSNILVTPDGEVKLLDFGIAKLIVADESVASDLTELSGRALTPAFASPEQLAGRLVTTSSDVYSLGMILFELLSGESPFLPKRNTPAALEDSVFNAPPRRPSQTVVEGKAPARSATARKLASALRGDLDNITLKALQKQPEQRYATVDAFRSDIESYLAGQPILARPESRWYRAGKFVQRHRLAVLSAVSVFLALAIGLTVALWQANIAQRQARTSQAVQEFTEDLFQTNSRDQPDPVKARQTTARELLDIGARKVDGKLNDAPEAKLRMLSILAGLYLDLGLEDQAVSLQKKRVALARSLDPSGQALLVPALLDLANGLHASRSVNERGGVLLEAKAILDRHHDFTSPARARLLTILTEHYASTDLAKSSAFAGQAIALFRRVGPQSELASALYTGAITATHTRDYRGGLEMFKEAIDISRRVNGDPNPDLPRYYAFQSECEDNLFLLSDAERSLRRAYQEALAISGPDEVDTIETESRLGTFLAHASRYSEAFPFLIRAKDACLRTKGAADPFYTPQMLLQYGIALAEFGKLEEGLVYISQAVENRRLNRPGTRYLGQMLENQASVLVDLGGYGEAADRVAESLAISQRVGQNPDYLFQIVQPKIAIARGDVAELARLVARYQPPLPSEAAPISYSLLRNLDARTRLALLQSQPDTAIALASRARALIVSNSQRSYLKRLEMRAGFLEGRSYLLARQPAKALPLLQDAVSIDRAIFHPNSPETARAEATLGACFLELGDRVKASAHLAQASSIRRAHPRLSEEFLLPIRDLEDALRHSRASH